MLDNCGAELKLAIGFVHTTIDMKSKGYVCAHTCLKERQEQLQRQKGSEFKMGVRAKKLLFYFFAKRRGPKNVVNCQLLKKAPIP